MLILSGIIGLVLFATICAFDLQEITNVRDNLASGVGGIVYNNACRDSPY